jgi:hypothetical protein
VCWGGLEGWRGARGELGGGERGGACRAEQAVAPATVPLDSTPLRAHSMHAQGGAVPHRAVHAPRPARRRVRLPGARKGQLCRRMRQSG